MQTHQLLAGPILTLILWMMAIAFSFAQTQGFSLSGTVRDEQNQPLPGVNVLLTHQTDSTLQKGVITDIDGQFQFNAVRQGSYLLRISFVGYQSLERTVEMDETQKDLEMLTLTEDSEILQEVEVQGIRARAEQIGDTIQYNADAYKTNPDANAEDLLSKMPGIIRENGKVKAQGEDVKRVLVDGNEFFADDPTLALKNLPAEIIDKVQVYDEMSDQSKFTGFDDGNSLKTINIITKPGKSNGQFGKLFGGYGTDNRYLGGGNLNFFNGDQRISVIGLTNNINQQNFSTQDLMGVVGSTSERRGGGRGYGGGGNGRRGGMRGNGGGGTDVSDFLVGQQGGISRMNAFGLNYSDKWGDNIKVNGSYFFNGTNNFSSSLLSRNYFSERGPSQLYEEDNLSRSSHLNHRFNFRLEYTIDENNAIIVNPKLNIQDFQSNSSVEGLNKLATSIPLSAMQNNHDTDYFGYNFSNNILFRHRLSKPRRTLSVNLGTEYNSKEGASSLYSMNEYFQSDSTLLLNQQSGLISNGYTLSGNIAYTEPIGKAGMLMLDYNSSYTKSASDKNTFNIDEKDEEIRTLDSTLTNIYDNLYLTQRTGVGYMLRGKNSNLMLRLNYQYAQLSGIQEFPSNLNVERHFNNILPMAMFRYNFANKSNLRVFYRTSTNPPSVEQLQSVIDNTNPLLLRAGNPNLSQQYNHQLVTRYGYTNPENARNFFVFLMGSYTHDYVGNATLIAEKDTVIAKGIVLFQGSQLTRPVNLDGNWQFRSFLTYGLPVNPLKSNLNLNAGISYTRTPGLINDALNQANTYNLSTGFVLGSNVSEALDFTLSYAANYNIVDNTIISKSNNNYFSQHTGFKLNWLFGKNFVFNTDVTHTLYTGLADDYNQDFLLLNAGIGYKFLKNKAAEIKLSAFDLLNQNNSIARTVTETYIEDNETQVLNRFFMLTLTYNLRNFVVKDK